MKFWRPGRCARVATRAYNLPNDDRVVQQKGSKRVMLKNVTGGKVPALFLCRLQVASWPNPRSQDVKFEPSSRTFSRTKLMHGLGPHQIQVAGAQRPPVKR